MLGTENTIHIDFVVDEIKKSNISLEDKIKLLDSLMKYEGHNDNFKDVINAAKAGLKKVQNVKKQLVKSKKPFTDIKEDGECWKKGNTTYVETIYGSFVDKDEYGMVQQKNAMSRKELIKYGYIRIK